MGYKYTLNLPSTKFAMRAQLRDKELSVLKFWSDISLYNLFKDRSKSFIIHDGPPYANGQIHVGHAFNKILKDIIGKFKLLSGYKVSFIPGWDCHGLPIELNVEKTFINKSKCNFKLEFRNKCREYALTQINIQKQSFKRLGINADWENYYCTMDYSFEADILKSLRSIIKNNFLYCGSKPVYWCIDCKSALADAEIDYINKKSYSIYVMFFFKTYSVISESFLKKHGIDKVAVLVWTTTPWTLPFNEAVALNGDMIYSLLKCKGIGYIVVNTLLDDICKKMNIIDYSVIKDYKGTDFEGGVLLHPFLSKESKIILSDHVKSDAGTGCVHIAPAYGYEDYHLGHKYGLEIINSIDEDGCVYNSVVQFAGLFLDDLNVKVISLLKNNLFLKEVIEHRYPHCWRHNISLFFRTTSQWFIKVSDHSLQALSHNVIDKQIQWYPKWGKKRMYSMLSSRPDWCISRQRLWGVPIMLFVNKLDNNLHPDTIDILDKLVDLVRVKGLDIWFDDGVFDLFCIDKTIYKKVNDILDVWYDSSITHRYVCNNYKNLSLPFDLCIEGTDQYRGWFQGSLLTSLIIDGNIPYKQVLTHGFVLDNIGRKMSKSLNNVISPLEVINVYGADILRLWVSSVNYNFDVNLSNEILLRICEAYRKIRNTMRFLLSNIADFVYDIDSIDMNNMLELDIWILLKLDNLKTNVINSYENYNFHLVYKDIYKFCTNDLGSRYLDIIKDRLYTTKCHGGSRRSAQSVLYFLVNILIQLLSPILSFTAEEAWKHLPYRKSSTVFLTEFLDFRFDSVSNNAISIDLWHNLFFIKTELNKLLEKYRSVGFIGTSLEVNIYIFCNRYWFDLLSFYEKELSFFFIVSNVYIIFVNNNNNMFESIQMCGFIFSIKKSEHGKCERCWMRNVDHSFCNYINICKRCITNLYSDGEKRLYF